MTAIPPTEHPQIGAERGALSAFIGYGLLLVSLFTGGVSGLIAMILAYDRAGQSGPVPATHLRFQLKIFWICFALTLAAGALGIGGLFSLLGSLPLSHPDFHGQPDAQLVRISESGLVPAALQTWSYGFELHEGRAPFAATLQMTASALMLAGAVLFSWIGPIYGIARLAAGRPIGQPRPPVV
jgi:hypothetical protein